LWRDCCGFDETFETMTAMREESRIHPVLY
jgi:hypothetical protein